MASHDELDRQVVDAVRDLVQAAAIANERLARRYGLNAVDLQTLGVLMRETHPHTAGWVAARTELPTSTVTRVLDRLEARGFIRREPDPTDRRKIVVEAVIDGMESTEAGDNPYADTIDRLRDVNAGFSVAELQVIVAYLRQVTASGASVGLPPEPTV